MVGGNDLPSVFVEADVSETLPDSQDDMKQGFLGGNPHVRVAIAVKMVYEQK